MSPISQNPPIHPTEQQLEAVTRLCEEAFGPTTRLVGPVLDIGNGRATFARVFRATLEVADNEPQTVVIKIPIEGANRQAAVDSGAYQREAQAYREFLPESPVATPTCHLIDEPDDGTCALVLQDLSDHRHVDQLDGLSPDDAAAALVALHRFHRHWSMSCDQLDVRRITIAGFTNEGLTAGLHRLETHWSALLDDRQLSAFAHLVENRKGFVAAYERHQPTLCHGDPRADNLVFAGQESPVLFDWQQLAIQPAEADIAWLMATSVETETRRSEEFDLLREVNGDSDRYRLGMTLPGLAVLMLAQREIDSPRAQEFVETSIRRIATAVVDLELDRLSPEGNLRG